MDGFVGTHERSLDEKGRLALPPSFRSKLGETCLISLVEDQPALAVWTREDFAEAVARLRERVDRGEVSQNRQRRFVANVHEVKQDNQGRITLPASFRDKVSIGREAMVNGAWSRVEIWNPDTWAEVNGEDEDDIDGSYL